MAPPALSSDRATATVEFPKPSATNKWNRLPSWEQYIEMIEHVERVGDGDLIVYFKLFTFLSVVWSDNLALCREGESLWCREESFVCASRFPHKVRSSIPLFP